MDALGFLQPLELYGGPGGRAILVLGAIFQLVWYAVVAVIVAVIALMVVRFALNYADLNPFSRPVIFVRRLTDPLVNPVRRALLGFGIHANGAPLVVILLAILLGYFVQLLSAGVLDTVAGVALSVSSMRPGGVVALVGYLLHGALTLYMLFVVIRIIFSWGQVSYANRVMRFLVNATEPLLAPLRRTVPPVGVFDISPIVAFIIIWLFQAAIRMTLLRGWQVYFFT